VIDALMAGFPAGTLSGAPKVRAMQIIDELEKQKRGPYGGCVGYFSADGEMDSCIVLRTALVKDGVMYVQAGGGVVADSDPERALRKLRRLNSGVLVMTRGEEGSVALDGDAFHVAPAFKVKVVDGTGAGDVFRAGFIYGVLQAWAVPDILRFANAAAALSCTKLGAIPSVPTLAEIQELLEPKA
jgi:hypothetical protein